MFSLPNPAMLAYLIADAFRNPHAAEGARLKLTASITNHLDKRTRGLLLSFLQGLVTTLESSIRKEPS